MNFKKTFFYVSTFIIILCVQIMGSRVFAPFGITPNYLLILTIYFSLIRGPLIGEMLGFFWGLGADSITVELFGAQAFLLTVVGFLSGRMSRKLDESKPWALMIFVFCMSVLYFAGLYVLNRIFAVAGRNIGFAVLIFNPLLNALLAPFIYWITRQWVQLWFPKSRLRLKLK